MTFRVLFMPDRLPSTAGQHRRDPPREKQLAEHRAVHTLDHFKKSFVGQGFSGAESDKVQWRKKRKMKAPFSVTR